MSFGAGTHWAFDTGGSNNNGGGFDTGNANMPTDLATSNGTDAAPVVTSGSYTFVTSDVGHWLFIKSGSNSIPGWYQVASIVASPNSATLTAGVGAAVKFSTTARIIPNTAQGIGTAASLSTLTWAMDYSQSTTVKQAYIDGVVQATTTQIVSVTRPFTVADVGNIFNVTSGGTVQQAQLVSVAAGVGTFDKAMGTATNICVGNFGGVLALPTGALFDSSVAGNYWWMKAGTYTLTGDAATGSFGSGTLWNSFEGFNTVRGDSPTLGNRPYVAGGGYAFGPTGSFWMFKNITEVTTVTSGFTASSYDLVVNCKATNSRTTGSSNAFSGGASTNFISCEGVAILGYGFMCGYGLMQNCYAHDSNVGIYSSGGEEYVVQCISAFNTSAAFLANVTHQDTLLYSTFFGSTNQIGIGINLSTASQVAAIGNNIVGFATGISSTTSIRMNFADRNNFYNCGTPRTNFNAGPNDIALDPQFVSVGDIGSNLCTNGADWTGATGSTPPTGWSVVTAATYTITAGGQAGNYLKIAHNGANNNPETTYSFSTTVGKSYRITFYVGKGTATNIIAKIGTSSGGSQIWTITYTDAAWTNKTISFEATATTTYFGIKATTTTSGQYVQLDEVTIYEQGEDFTVGAHMLLDIDWTKMGC